MGKPTITEIENAFQPAREVSNATRFAGRNDAVTEAYYALIASGAHIAIVGNRGIGKTSLSRQITNIATGDNDLLQKLGLPHDRKLDFLTVYFACGNFSGVSGYVPNDNRFSLPPWRYFKRHHLPPLGATSRYSPPPSNRRKALGAGFAWRMAVSVRGMGATPIKLVAVAPQCCPQRRCVATETP